MKIATWNVNSIRQRERHVARWLEQCQPDVLLLQEIKCEATGFPALAYHGLGDFPSFSANCVSLHPPPRRCLQPVQPIRDGEGARVGGPTADPEGGA